MKDLIESGLEMLGATGLVNPDIGCGCGLDDFMPCGCANEYECRAAYAVMCDGSLCEECQYREGVAFSDVCFVPVEDFHGGSEGETMSDAIDVAAACIAASVRAERRLTALAMLTRAAALLRDDTDERLVRVGVDARCLSEQVKIVIAEEGQ